nr:hypothetical protein [Cereibacter azotoformans]
MGPQEQQPDRERIGRDLVAQPPAVVQHREARRQRRQLRDLVQKADLLARRAAEPLARDLPPRGGMDEPQDDLHRTLVSQETAAKHEIGRFARLASLVVDHVQLAQRGKLDDDRLLQPAQIAVLPRIGREILEGQDADRGPAPGGHPLKREAVDQPLPEVLGLDAGGHAMFAREHRLAACVKPQRLVAFAPRGVQVHPQPIGRLARGVDLSIRRTRSSPSSGGAARAEACIASTAVADTPPRSGRKGTAADIRSLADRGQPSHPLARMRRGGADWMAADPPDIRENPVQGRQEPREASAAEAPPPGPQRAAVLQGSGPAAMAGQAFFFASAAAFMRASRSAFGPPGAKGFCAVPLALRSL